MKVTGNSRSCFVVWLGFAALVQSSLCLAQPQRPDLTLPVMPNSIYAGMATAVLLSPDFETIHQKKALTESAVTTVDLNGSWKYQADYNAEGMAQQWYSPALDDTSWLTMSVPSNYSREDPALSNYFGAVWFRRHIELASSELEGTFTLQFEGVDYFATVWVNGQSLAGNGEHEGYFGPFQFDVTDLMQPGDNLITVMVTNPYDYGQDEVGFPTIYPTLAEKVWIKGIFNFHDLRPGDGLRGPEKQDIGTGGIVGNVSLRRTGDVLAIAAFVTPIPGSDARNADLLVDVVLENRSPTAHLTNLTLECLSEQTGDFMTGSQASVLVPPGFSRLETQLRLTNPELWATHDQTASDRAPLYRLSSTVAIASTVSDQRIDRFGIRSAEMSEQGSEAYWYKLNGRRTFLRGSNVIPTEWLAEADRALYEQDAELFRRANMNVQRVHAHVQSDDFYDVSDEQGILLIQDFALQWEYSVCDFVRPNGDPTLTNNADVMARLLADMMYRLYNHPSVGMYILHNEPLYVFTSVIAGQLVPEPGTGNSCPEEPFSEENPQNIMLDYSLNTTLDYEFLEPVAASIESSRPIHIGSGFGDEHLYDGWYSTVYTGMYDWAPKMATEYGAQAASYRAEQFLREWIGDDYWPPATEELRHKWRYHDAQLANSGIYWGRAHVSYDDFPTWAFASQLYQATLLKYGNEVLRSRRFAPTGIAIHFTFHNWWDSITWGYVDADRTPLMAYQSVATSMSPVASMIVVPSNIFDPTTPILLPITVINDRFSDLVNITLSWDLREESDSYYLRGDPAALFDYGYLNDPPTYAGVPPRAITVTAGHRELIEMHDHGELTLFIPADSNQVVANIQPELTAPSGEERHFSAIVQLWDESGYLLHENLFHFIVVDSMEAFLTRVPIGISPLPRFNLDIEVTGGQPATVTVERLFGNELVLDHAEIQAQSVLPDLKPGRYHGLARVGDNVREQYLTLENHGLMRFEFDPVQTPEPSPADQEDYGEEASPANTPLDSASSGCDCDISQRSRPSHPRSLFALAGFIVVWCQQRRRILRTC